ncbi:MAG: hypothetical protein JHD04_01765 [Nocardioides sp.]|jgi:hypothetical protein|uniref:Heparin binding hemagglutinin HbhA n=1 Tax=Nocardioides kribbensis TaxID=305517 RepID=A0ABV1NXM1_9ACTN|nr:hypothetical protein [Nocardioides sp. Leaf307]KQQ42932.1 hypothetical protein ASF50_02655 [Nocardioides sp. Leaf307]MBJ7528236.1 hypothetical protein [Nocardioides sp.]
MAKAKFDIKTEATKGLYAGAGVADLAVEAVRDYVADVQKKVSDVQKDVHAKVNGLKPAALRDKATTAVSNRVETITDEAKARREAIEARVAELQALPTRVQSAVNENVDTATSAYADLAKRGEVLVGRIRKQESTQATVKQAKSTKARAKTTATQAKKSAEATTKQAETSAKSTAETAKKAAASTRSTAKTAAKKTTSTAKTAAKKTTTTAKKTSAPAQSSAKATTTTAKKTASAATEAVTEAAKKVGD